MRLRPFLAQPRVRLWEQLLSWRPRGPFPGHPPNLDNRINDRVGASQLWRPDLAGEHVADIASDH
jgi:hypothetical protein